MHFTKEKKRELNATAPATNADRPHLSHLLAFTTALKF